MRAIHWVHGTADTLVPISQARSLHQALLNSGLDHLYQEHDGNHQFLNDLSLSFLSTSLVGTELFVQPPSLSLVTADGETTVRFATQQGVEYRVERTASLEGSNTHWIQIATLSGTGENARVPVPIVGNGEYFRVGAVNRGSP